MNPKYLFKALSFFLLFNLANSYTEYSLNTTNPILRIDNYSYRARYLWYSLPDYIGLSGLETPLMGLSFEGYLPLPFLNSTVHNLNYREKRWEFRKIPLTNKPVSYLGYYQGDYDFKYVQILYGQKQGKERELIFSGDNLIYDGRYGLNNGLRTGSSLHQNYLLQIRSKINTWQLALYGNYRLRFPSVINLTSRKGYRKSKLLYFTLVASRNQESDSLSLSLHLGGELLRYKDNLFDSHLHGEYNIYSLRINHQKPDQVFPYTSFRAVFNSDNLSTLSRRWQNTYLILEPSQHFFNGERITVKLSEYLFFSEEGFHLSLLPYVSWNFKGGLTLQLQKSAYYLYPPFAYRFHFGQIQAPLESNHPLQTNQWQLLFNISPSPVLNSSLCFYYTRFKYYPLPVFEKTLNGIKFLTEDKRLLSSRLTLSLLMKPFQGKLLFEFPFKSSSKIEFNFFRYYLVYSLSYEHQLFNKLKLTATVTGTLYEPERGIAYSYTNDLLYLKSENEQQIHLSQQLIQFWDFEIKAEIKSFTAFYRVNSLTTREFIPIPETLFQSNQVLFGVRWWFLD